MTKSIPSPAGGPEVQGLAREGAVPALPVGGNDAAFEDLVASHQRRVELLASRLLGWSQDVHDVVQEVFLSALRNWRRFRGESSIGTWLGAITVNQCRIFQRRQWLRRLLLLRRPDRGQAPAAHDPAGDGLRAERAARVQQAVSRLRQPFREAIVLRYLEGLSTAEVAEVLGISVEAVDVRLHRARARLREMLGGIAEP